MKRGSITVFSALSFMLIASFLFALLEAGRDYQLSVYADLTSDLSIESVFAEYQPKLWQDYHLLALDGAYGGENFGIEYVTGVLGARIRKNLDLKGAAGQMMGIAHSDSYAGEYELLTDGEGSVFLRHIADYMQKNLPIEMVQKLYDQYVKKEEIENGRQTGGCVENAQKAIEDAKKEREQQKEGDADRILPETPGRIEENPLALVLQIRRNALLGIVTGGIGELSDRRGAANVVEKRVLEKGSTEHAPQANLYDRVLVLEYMDRYFSDYLSEMSHHARAYELEYVLCGKETDKDNLEGVVERLLLIREAANVTHILADAKKRSEALGVANVLAGFTGNPVVVQVVQIGVVAAWAYVESILDIRALLAGDRVALLKNGDEWTTCLGGLTEVLGDGTKSKDCAYGFSYQDYLKGFLFTMGSEKLAYRMLDIIEQNIRQVPAYRNCRVDHLICGIAYRIEYTADPLFWNFSVLGGAEPEGRIFYSNKSFSYY